MGHFRDQDVAAYKFQTVSKTKCMLRYYLCNSLTHLWLGESDWGDSLVPLFIPRVIRENGLEWMDFPVSCYLSSRSCGCREHTKVYRSPGSNSPVQMPLDHNKAHQERMIRKHSCSRTVSSRTLVHLRASEVEEPCGTWGVPHTYDSRH